MTREHGPIRQHHLAINLSVSARITAAETKQYADKLVNTRSQRAPSTSAKPDMKREFVPRKETSQEVREIDSPI
jgi:hypothetical protein